MKVPMSWLLEHVALTEAEKEQLVRRLSETGTEVAAEETVDGERVIEIEITPNRGDLLSIHGLARDVAAAFGRPLPASTAQTVSAPAMPGAVRIDRGVGCRRYFGARIENVRVSPSPAAVAAKLRPAGFALFNNVVDITNYILAEFGQPLHAFDADKLGGPIHVRKSRSAEKIAALDGKTYDLADDMVIADDRGPVAVAGIIGGTPTSVTDATTTVFLECAWFEPGVVRRTSRRLGITTESSFRFERHVDEGGMERAFFRAIRMIEEIAQGRCVGIEMAGTQECPQTPSPIAFSTAALERLAGIRLADDVISGHLAAVGCALVSGGASRWTVTPPSYRPDLKIPEDLIEEVVRLHGIDRIEGRTPSVHAARPWSVNRQALGRIRRAALAMGLAETIHMSFISAAELKSVGVDPGEAVALENPLSLNVSHLRPTLLAGILSSLSLNLRRGTSDSVRFFEMGPVFLKGAPGDRPCREELRMALVLAGMSRPAHFSDPARPVEFYDLKGILMGILTASARCAVNPVCIPAAIAGFDPTHSAAMQIGETVIGCLGRIGAATAQAFDVPGDIYLAEISLSRILAFEDRSPKHRPLPRFPSIRRDLSLVVSSSVTANDIRRVVAGAGLPHLVKYDVFDLYRGKGLPEGSYAVGLMFTFQSSERTLSDEEANAARDYVLSLLTDELGAKLRV